MLSNDWPGALSWFRRASKCEPSLHHCIMEREKPPQHNVALSGYHRELWDEPTPWSLLEFRRDQSREEHPPNHGNNPGPHGDPTQTLRTQLTPWGVMKLRMATFILWCLYDSGPRGPWGISGNIENENKPFTLTFLIP